MYVMHVRGPVRRVVNGKSVSNAVEREGSGVSSLTCDTGNGRIEPVMESRGSGESYMPENTKKSALLLGLGLDNQDGHKRVTRGEEFLLVGGSSETHEKMQETAIRFSEQLDKRGKRLADVSAEELRDIAHKAGMTLHEPEN